jgi:phosphate transport system permease protein
MRASLGRTGGAAGRADLRHLQPDGRSSQFTALPVQIFNWISRLQEEFRMLAAAAIVVLLVVLLAMNSVAIWLRNRFYQRRW